MKRFITAGLLTALILFPMFGYMYMQGMMDGVARYHNSKQFEMTLLSMYMFGARDACANPAACASLPGTKK